MEDLRVALKKNKYYSPGSPLERWAAWGMHRGQRLTVSLHSIILKNSRSRTLSSAVEIPPTLAYTLFRQNESQKVFEAIAMDVMTKRWQVSEFIVNRGLRSQI